LGGLVFGAFLLGMGSMFLFGLGYDRRVRAALREQYNRRPPPGAYPMHSPPEPPP
jgi:hypothetical protein